MYYHHFRISLITEQQTWHRNPQALRQIKNSNQSHSHNKINNKRANAWLGLHFAPIFLILKLEYHTYWNQIDSTHDSQCLSPWELTTDNNASWHLFSSLAIASNFISASRLVSVESVESRMKILAVAMEKLILTHKLNIFGT